ncbi:MAG: hypothetical protein WBH24_19460 [Candidatus Acidiferrum sp.]|jgi:hypothetical protein
MGAEKKHALLSDLQSSGSAAKENDASLSVASSDRNDWLGDLDGGGKFGEREG